MTKKLSLKCRIGWHKYVNTITIDYGKGYYVEHECSRCGNVTGTATPKPDMVSTTGVAIVERGESNLSDQAMYAISMSTAMGIPVTY